MPAENINNLRAIVRRRRSAVTAKENRIKRNTGVDIRGTKEDPRKPINAVKEMGRRELNNYLAELNRFMSRSSGFVAGNNGALIPKKDWLEYKRLEKQYNNIGNLHFESIANIFIPLSGMTVAERERLMEPDSKRAQGDIRHKPFSPLNRDSTNIKSKEALDKLKKSLESKVRPDYLPRQIKEARSQLKAMLKGVGNGSLIRDANALTDAQFNVLWNYTGFAGSVSRVYGSGSHRGKNIQDDDSSDIYSTSVVEDFSVDVREFFEWAKSIELPKKGS